MKKSLAIFLAIGAVVYISCKNLDQEIIENKVYTINIDFPIIKNQPIGINDTKIIEKSKEILISIYGEFDFSQFDFEVNSSDQDEVSAYIINEQKDGYFIGFDANEGVLKFLGKLSEYTTAGVNSNKSVDELKEISMKNIEKLQVIDLDNYKYFKHKIYNNKIMIQYRNEKINKEITITLDVKSGELLEYSQYSFPTVYLQSLTKM